MNLPVSGKARTIAEHFSTFPAHVKPRFTVSLLMSNEVGTPGKESPTLTALKRLGSGMSVLMVHQVTIFAEQFPTFIALIWLFSSMNGLMLNQGAVTPESLSTFSALKTLFLRVNVIVSEEMGVSAERFPALTALKRLLVSSGCSLVLDKYGILTKGLVIITAFIVLVPSETGLSTVGAPG